MHITKFGHCCLLLEENGVRVLTDPGNLSALQNEEANVQAVVITHEHADHCHTTSIKQILAKNPNIVIVTNTAVGAVLARENIPHTAVEHGQRTEIRGLSIEGFGTQHAAIHPLLPAVMNTGYCIGERFFLPGDAFVVPGKKIDVLALPIAGSWMKLGEAIDYALRLQPSVCIPIHDGILHHPEMTTPHMEKALGPSGIRFVELQIGEKTTL